MEKDGKPMIDTTEGGGGRKNKQYRCRRGEERWRGCKRGRLNVGSDCGRKRGVIEGGRGAGSLVDGQKDKGKGDGRA